MKRDSRRLRLPPRAGARRGQSPGGSRRASRVLLAVTLLAIALPGVCEQTPVSGTASVSLAGMVQPAAPLDSTLEGGLRFAPVIRMEAPFGRFDLSASVSWSIGPPGTTPEINRLSLSLAPVDFLTLKLGRFAYLPGYGGAASATDFFVRRDLLSVLTGDITSSLHPADMIQLGLSWRESALLLTFSPLAPSPFVPDPSSPWFPAKDYPGELFITYPTPQEIHLSGIVVEEPPPTRLSARDLSLGAELRTDLPFLQLSLLAYHGTDNRSLYQPRYSFPNGVWSDYQIILTPVNRIIDSVGMNARLGSPTLAAWVDCAYTFSRAYLSRRLWVITDETEQVTIPDFEYAVGVDWTIEPLRLSVGGAYHGLQPFTGGTLVVRPLLGSYLMGRARFGLPGDTITLATQGVFSTTDRSSALLGTLSFSPSDTFSVELTLPVFLGAPDTELGQFAQNHLVSIATTSRF